MFTHDLEDWLIAMSMLIAVAVPVAGHALSGPLASEAVAAVPDRPQYTMTITAKRIPAACKGLEAATAPATCAPFLNGETTLVVRERGAN